MTKHQRTVRMIKRVKSFSYKQPDRLQLSKWREKMTILSIGLKPKKPLRKEVYKEWRFSLPPQRRINVLKLAVSRFKPNQKMADYKLGNKLWVFSHDAGVKNVPVNSKSFWQIDGRRIYHRLLKTKFPHKTFCWEHL